MTHTLAVSSDNWVNLFTGFAVAISILFQRHSEWQARRDRSKIENKLDKNTEITAKVESKVNGVLLAHLELIAKLTKRIAGLTKNKKDKERADLARKNLTDHIESLKKIK